MKVPWVGSNHTTHQIATYCIWYRTMLGSVIPTPTRSCPLPVQTTHLIAVAESAGPAVQHGVELLRDALVERGLTTTATTLGERVERPGADAEIGRASCRERVWVPVAGASPQNRPGGSGADREEASA